MPAEAHLDQVGTNRRIRRALNKGQSGLPRDWELLEANWPTDFKSKNTTRIQKGLSFPIGFVPGSSVQNRQSTTPTSKPATSSTISSTASSSAKKPKHALPKPKTGGWSKPKFPVTRLELSSDEDDQATTDSDDSDKDNVTQLPTKRDSDGKAKIVTIGRASSTVEEDFGSGGRPAMVGGLSSLGQRWKKLGQEHAFAPQEPGGNEALLGLWKPDTSIRRIVLGRVTTHGTIEFILRDFTGDFQKFEPAERDQQRFKSNVPLAGDLDTLADRIQWTHELPDHITESDLINFICDDTKGKGHPWRGASDIAKTMDLGALWRLIENNDCDFKNTLAVPYTYDPARQMATISQVMVMFKAQVTDNEETIKKLGRAKFTNVLSPIKILQDTLFKLWQSTFEIQKTLIESRRQAFVSVTDVGVPPSILDLFKMNVDGGTVTWTQGALEADIEAAVAAAKQESDEKKKREEARIAEEKGQQHNGTRKDDGSAGVNGNGDA
ncbi:hypothetical protein LTR84_010658 [Exophiala bonariae]|uniref:Uncharacterized protein n=1 Tax=Exophiala bonariae TaxID=1690606 RepID=A0AAV9MVI6_9EURO|nr:hypothetical protein LTR84_010658 [Exophiala bonariae]